MGKRSKQAESRNRTLKTMTIETPCMIPVKSDTCVAFYLESKEDFFKAMFDICLKGRTRVGNWDPFCSDRDNFEKFKEEYVWNDNFVEGLPSTFSVSKGEELPGGPGWYIFQCYRKEEEYWSEKYGRYEDVVHFRVLVSKLSDVKKRTEEFFSFFDGRTDAYSRL